MFFKFFNNVLSTISSAVSTGDSTISINTESGINNPPPDPDGGTASLTIVDDLTSPTKIEIIYYTGISGTGPYTLTGCLRGQEGTTDQDWAVGQFIFQDETAASILNAALLHSNTINQNSKVPDEFNALMVGPITVGTDKSLTLGTNSILVIQ